MAFADKPQRVAQLVELLGRGVVFADDASVIAHTYDAWPVAAKWRSQGKHTTQPDVVVRPTSVEQICRLLPWAAAHGVPVTPWGLGSSVTGAPLPTRGGVSLDLSALTRVHWLDESSLMVKVDAGKLGIALERELNSRGFTLNHSPQSLDRSSVGGWVSTRASGQFSSRYGSIEDLVVALTAVLPTGEIVATPFAPRAALGPDLRHVFMGAEGTMGVVVDVTLKIFPLAEHRRLETLRFPDVAAGLDAMQVMFQKGLRPFLVRFYDEDESRHAMRDVAFDGCTMFLGVEGVHALAEAEFAVALSLCEGFGGQRLGPQAVEAWWARRFDFSTVENLLAKSGGLAETIEVAHFWGEIFDTYRALKTALAPYAAEVLGHFSHAYPQGTSLYIILLGEAADDAEAEARILQVWDTAMAVCLETGATLSHHHGVGLARLPYIEQGLGSGYIVLERIKGALDPAHIMNPGKLGLT